MKPDYQQSKIFIALPALAEMLYLPQFIKCVSAQSFKNYELIICVNQPENWWQDEKHLMECRNNEESLEWLKNQEDIKLTVIDKSSKGNGWELKKSGVGWARKTLMDYICGIADETDIILSLDADTNFNADYFQSIVNNFKNNPKHVAIAVPYYHSLTEDEKTNRDILRYEIYMRHYALNLWRIKSPYNFSALGSAIAVPVWVYKRVGGITPHKSGEDFYFLLKLKKFGTLSLWNNEKVFPAARYSNRVLFGTGPAMIKGASGDWSSYPIYNFKYFDEIEQTYALFEKLFQEEIDFPMKNFLENLFKDGKWYEPLRKNSKNSSQFVKACQHKVDALRILQYLKERHKQCLAQDEKLLSGFIQKFYSKACSAELSLNINTWSFTKSSIAELNELRNFLVSVEDKYQKNER